MKRWLLAGGGALILALAWYGLSPLFMNTRINDALPAQTPPPASAPVGSRAESVPSPSASPADQPTAATTVSEPVPIVDTPLHPASGSVRIIRNDDGTLIRYENYKTINGPDVRVYLAKDLKATEYVDLGPLKGTEGNINYPVPAEVNVDDYRYVLTWCEDFAVLFNSADLALVR